MFRWSAWISEDSPAVYADVSSSPIPAESFIWLKLAMGDVATVVPPCFYSGLHMLSLAFYSTHNACFMTGELEHERR